MNLPCLSYKHGANELKSWLSRFKIPCVCVQLALHNSSQLCHTASFDQLNSLYFTDKVNYIVLYWIKKWKKDNKNLPLKVSFIMLRVNHSRYLSTHKAACSLPPVGWWKSQRAKVRKLMERDEYSFIDKVKLHT